MPLAIALSEWLDLAVALGTLTMAAATFWMARGTSKLAMTTEKQRQASIAPVVRLVRWLRHDIAAIRVAGHGGYLIVPLENLGPLPVTIEAVELEPGNKGEVASQADYLSPQIEPGERRDFHFRMSDHQLAECKRAEVVLTVTYRALVTGSRFTTQERVQQSMDGWGEEQWCIVGSEIPRRLEWVDA
jgi:hypothetical protein